MDAEEVIKAAIFDARALERDAPAEFYAGFIMERLEQAGFSIISPATPMPHYITYVGTDPPWPLFEVRPQSATRW